MLGVVREHQVADAKYVTDLAIGSMMSDHIEAKLEVPNSLTLDPDSPKTNRKMSSEPQLDSHHRLSLESNSNDLPLSFDNGLGPDLLNTDICLPHVHQKRMKVFTTTETTMKSRINFPSPNDKIWGKIDLELDQIIPTIFPDSLCNKLTPTELSQKFDVWLYNFFIDRFGNKPEKGKKTAQRKPSSC